VPSALPGLVRCSSDSMVAALIAMLSGLSVTFASPKSRIFACPRFVTKIFAGLDVSVNDSFCVCRVQGIRDLDAQIEHRFDLQRLAIDPVPERLPLQQFHCDEGSTVGLVNLVDRADVRMVQRGRSFGFSLETAEGLRVVGKIIGKKLQGNVATQLEVFSFIHHTHPAAADPAEDAVMGNRLTYGLRRRGH
jgi:hypothetical protein